jgi:hypothetical protein
MRPQAMFWQTGTHSVLSNNVSDHPIRQRMWDFGRVGKRYEYVPGRTQRAQRKPAKQGFQGV